MLPAIYVEIYHKVNTFELPDLGMIGTWIAGNVDENYQQQLNTDVQRCFKVLSTSLVNIQNNCDTAAHLMNCLSTDDEVKTFILKTKDF